MTYTKWISTPLPTRMQIAEMLGVRKLRPTHVADNQVVDDGYNFRDIEAGFTVDNLQFLTKSTLTDIGDLFDLLVDQIHNPQVVASKIDEAELEINRDEIDKKMLEAYESKPKTNGKGKKSK